MAGGRAFLIRTDNRHMDGRGQQLRGQSFDAIGKDPIVIADQDPQRGHEVIRVEVNLSVTAVYSRQLSVPEACERTVSLQQLTDQLEARAGSGRDRRGADADAEQLRVGLLGKKGRISGVLGAMGKLPGEERPVVGQRANVLKTQVQSLLSERLQAVKQAPWLTRSPGKPDVTAAASGVAGIAIP